MKFWTLALLLATACNSQTIPNAPIALELAPYHGAGHRTVTVEIAGRKTPFLFDTGGGITLVTPEIAKAAGCSPFGRLVGFRMRGERINLPRCDRFPLAVGGQSLEASTVGVFDINRLLPPTWGRLGGLLGLSSFSNKVIKLKLGQGRVDILDAPQTGRGTPLNLVVQASGFSTVALVAVEAPTGTLWLELDTGSSAGLILAPHAARALGADLSGPDVKHTPASNGKSERWRVSKLSLPLPGVGAVQTPATVMDIIYDGNIGAPLIAQFNWDIDLANRRVQITKPTATD